MVKIFKHRLIVYLIAVLSTFSALPTISASSQNYIDIIDISVEIQDDGSAIIRDDRTIYAISGTEHYISIGNLGDSQLKDFVVYDEYGNQLENIGEWDVNASFQQKSGKYGINYSGDNIELCVGLGEYGIRKFTFQYTITGFVKNLNGNGQAIYWKFLNSDMDKINNATVKILNNKGYKFKYPNTKIWGYGYEGTTEISEKELKAMSVDNFNSSNYMVLLVIFDENVFDTMSKLPYTDEEIFELAGEGSYNYENGDYLNSDTSSTLNSHNGNNTNEINNSRRSSGRFGLIGYQNYGGFITIIIMFIFGKLIYSVSKKSRSSKFNFSKLSDVQYYRDIPYENFEDTYYITESQFSDVISAFIIKWINLGYLKDDIEEVGLLFKKNELALRIIQSDPLIDTSIEKKLWDIVISASKGDGLLTQKEFNKYISKNIETFNSWVSSIEIISKVNLTSNGYLEKKEKKVFGIFSSSSHVVSEKGKNLQKNIAGFKKYLRDFSLLNERQFSEVKLWSEYIEWATFLGIAEEVYEQFKIVDPNISQIMMYNPNTIYYAHIFGRSVQSTYNSANSSYGSSFSGGGGSSFGGGGGGSFGGGFGGGTR